MFHKLFPASAKNTSTAVLAKCQRANKDVTLLSLYHKVRQSTQLLLFNSSTGIALLPLLLML